MASGHTDRNLLFGVLALQMDFVSREGLVRAMNAWALEKTRSLGEVLCAQGDLRGDERELLEALLCKHLEKHDNDPEKSLAALAPDGDVLSAVHETPDAELQACLTRLDRRPDALQEPTAPYAPSDASSDGRFRILRSHARGGLGEVHVAYDHELRREVALKEIQSTHAADNDKRSRFVLEAEVTGGLEHPSIVPVYSLGCYADGRPFYAMRFIRGDDLRDVIKRFHQDARGMPPGQRSLALRELLGRFVDVCNAVAYAHSRGVLHRDLKPGNVMVGKYGETLVVDWGLAKVLGKPADPAPQTEVPLSPSRAEERGETQIGTAMGTPAYMSPEQAAGRLDLLGPASDVYSLGATLYTLLTGQPPLSGEPDEILRKAQRGEFPPPRQMYPEVPRALEAICLKAMSFRPRDRYGSAQELSADVERWLADEPVTAYREPTTHRLARWMRRHKPLVAGAAALLTTAVVALTVTTVLVTGANSETKHALKDKDQALIDVEKRRLEAENEKKRADKEANEAKLQKGVALERLEQARQSMFTANLAEITHLVGTDPERARRSLDDPQRFPLDLRDWTWDLWYSLCGRERWTFSCTQTTAVLSPDGRMLAAFGSGSEGPDLRLADVGTGRVLHTIALKHRALGKPVFVVQGQAVAVLDDDRKLTLWHTQTGREIATHALEEHAGPILSSRFSPDGATLATAGWSKDILLWDVRSGKKASTLSRSAPSAEAATEMFFEAAPSSPNEPRLLTSTSSEVQLWDLKTGKATSFVAIRSGKPLAITLGINGQTLAMARNWSSRISNDDTSGIVSAWDVATCKEMFSVEGKEIVAAVPTPDRTGLVVGRIDGLVWLDLETGREKALPNEQMKAFVPSGFSPDGTLLTTAGRLGRSRTEPTPVKVWEWATGKEVATFDRGDPVLFSPDGRLLLTRGLRNGLSAWEMAPGDARLTRITGIAPVKKIALSPDGHSLAVALGRTLQVWDAATGSPRADVLVDEPVDSTAFSPDGKSLAVVFSSQGNTYLHVYDATGRRKVSTRKPAPPAKAIVFSPDGRAIITAHTQRPPAKEKPVGAIKVWDAVSLEEQATGPFDEGVSSVAVSPDGRFLAVGMMDGVIRLVEFPSLKAAGELKGHAKAVLGIAFAPRDRLLASAGEDGKALVWDLKSSQVRAALLDHSGPVNAIAFTPDGTTLITAGSDRTLKLWHAPSGRLRASLQQPLYPPVDLAVSADGKRLAAGCSQSGARTGEVLLWNADAGDRDRVVFPPDAGTSAPLVKWLDDGKSLLSVGRNGVVRLRDSKTGVESSASPLGLDDCEFVMAEGAGRVSAVQQTIEGGKISIRAQESGANGRSLTFKAPGGPMRLSAAARSPDGRSWAFLLGDNRSYPDRTAVVELWRGGKSQGRTRLEQPWSDFPSHLSSDGKTLISVKRGTLSDSELQVWDLESGKVRTSLPLPRGGDAPPVVVSADFRTLAVLTADRKSIAMIDVATGKERFHIPARLPGLERLGSFSRDGKLFACQGEPGAVVVWDVAEGKERCRVGRPDPLGWIAFWEFSPDGRLLLTATRAQGALKLWDTATGQEKFSLADSSVSLAREGELRTVFGVFSADGKTLLTRNQQQSVLWDTETGKVRAAVATPFEKVMLSPDGNTLAVIRSPLGEPTITLWDVADGKKRCDVSGHTGPVGPIAFSPDGKLLATTGVDWTIRLWDTATGRPALQLDARRMAPAGAMSFSADGASLLTVSPFEVRLWDVRPEGVPANGGREILHVSRNSAPPAMHMTQTAKFVADGNTLLLLDLPYRGGTGEVSVCDADTGEERYRLRGLPVPDRPTIFSSRDGRSTMILGSVAFSPDGQVLAVGTGDGAVRLYEASSGKEQGVLSGPPHLIRALAFSPDGKMLASASDRGVVTLWDLRQRKEQRTMRGHTGSILSLAFSRDGERLASAGFDLSIKVWQTTTGHKVADFRGHLDAIWGLDFSPDGARLASVDADGVVRLWPGEEKVAAPPPAPQEVATDRGGQPTAPIIWSPDQRWLARGKQDGTIALWDSANGEERSLGKRHQGAVFALLFTPDGKTLLSGGADRVVRVWDVESGRQRAALEGHTMPVRCLAFRPGDGLLASGSAHPFNLFESLRQGELCLWDLAAGKLQTLMRPHRGGVWSVAFSADGKVLATASDDTAVHVWDAAPMRVKQTLTGNNGPVWAVGFSPDGQVVTAGYEKNINRWGVKQWDPATGKETRIHSGAMMIQGAQGHLTSFCFVPGTDLLAFAAEGDGAVLWNTKRQQVVAALKGLSAPVSTVAAGGKVLAISAADGVTHIWDLDSLKERAFLGVPSRQTFRAISHSPDGKSLALGHSQGVSVRDAADFKELTKFNTLEVTSLAQSPDGALLVSGHRDGSLRWFDLKERKLLNTSPGPERKPGMLEPPVRSLAFSGDGKLLVVVGERQGMTLWDPATRKEVHRFADDAVSAAFSNDSGRLASGHADGVIRVWNVADRREVGRLEGAAYPPQGLAFSPDGKTLASTETMPRDGARKGWPKVRLWDLDKYRESASSAAGEENGPLWFTPDGRAVYYTGRSTQRGAFLARVDVSTAREEVVVRISETYTDAPALSPAPNGKSLALVSSRIEPPSKASWSLYVAEYPTTGPPNRRLLSIWKVDSAPLAHFVTQTNKQWLVARPSPDDPATVLLVKNRLPAVEAAVPVPLKGHTSPVVRALFTADGATLITAAGDGSVRIWEVATGKERAKLEVKGLRVLVLSPDQKTLATANAEGTVQMWDVARGTAVKDFKTSMGGVVTMAYSPDGALLALGGLDRTVRLWDVTAGKEQEALKDATQVVPVLAFSPDGKTLAGADARGTIHLWDVHEKKLRTSWPSSGFRRIVRLLFTPDGKTLLVSESPGGTVVVQDVSKGAQLGKIYVQGSLDGWEVNVKGDTLIGVSSQAESGAASTSEGVKILDTSFARPRAVLR